MAEANKIILNGQTLIDLTQDTATAADVRVGKTFHDASGEIVEGAYVPVSGGPIKPIVQGGLNGGGYITTFNTSDYGITSIRNDGLRCWSIQNLVIGPEVSMIDGNGCAGCLRDNYAGSVTILRDSESFSNEISLGGSAFAELYSCASFDMDPNINVTYLGDNAFSGLGQNRDAQLWFTLDFRNSTFTTLYNNTFLGVKDTDIYFPQNISLERFPYGLFGQISGVYAYFQNFISLPVDNPIDVFTDVAAGTGDNKFFFPYDIASSVKNDTTWSDVLSQLNGNLDIWGYSLPNTFNVGDTLPTMDSQGYALSWYRESWGTDSPVSVVDDASASYYCEIGARIAVPLSINELNCTVSVSDGVNNYTNGSFIPDGTTITIDATPASGYNQIYQFKLNGNSITPPYSYSVSLLGDTELSIVAQYYDGINIPVSPNFADNTPAQIKYAVDNGLHRTLWNIGDSITLHLNSPILNNNADGIQISDVEIVYIDQQANRYQKTGGLGYTNAVFMIRPLIDRHTYYGQYDQNTNYNVSYVNDLLQNDLLFDGGLPQDWKDLMQECKYSCMYYNDTSTTVYVDAKVAIPSAQELYGNRYVNQDYFDYGDTQFDYYSVYQSASALRDALIMNYNGNPTRYWTRSISYQSPQSNEVCVATDGYTSSRSVTYSNGYCIIFAV